MTARYLPGGPLGHLSPSGYWHPGPEGACALCALAQAEDATLDCSRCQKAISRAEWDAHLAWHRPAEPRYDSDGNLE